MAKIISVSNQKGGVGKTTTAVNVAAAMGMLGEKTLLIDLDPQGSATSGLGFDKKKIKKFAYDMLVNNLNPSDVILKTEFEKLSLIPSSTGLSAAEFALKAIPNKESVLKDKLESFKNNFDYIFIDCPPSLGNITVNALCACDSILIPMQCEYYALEGLSQLMNTVKIVKRGYNLELEIEGVVMTMANPRLNLTMQVIKEVKKNFPSKVFSTIIPRGVRVSEAPGFGKPVVYFDNGCKGSRAYIKIAKEICASKK